MSYQPTYNVVVSQDSVTYSRPLSSYQQAAAEDSDDSPSAESKVQLKGYKIQPHANSIVIKCPASKFESKTVKRSGITFYTTIKGVRYFAFFIDEAYGTLTDPSGKIFSCDKLGFEDPISGGARETKEETLDIYDYRSPAAIKSLKDSATVIYNPKMCMIFQPIVVDDPIKISLEYQRRYNKFNKAIKSLRERKGGKLIDDDLEAKLATFGADVDAMNAFIAVNDTKMTLEELDNKYRYAENSGLIWLSENELNELITWHPKEHLEMPIPERLVPFFPSDVKLMPRLYERCRSLLYVVLSNSSSII
jgi:hypothetical protein